jgi:hypothetical protein
MRIIFKSSTGEIIDWLENAKVSGLANGLQVVNIPDYSGNKDELNIEDVPGGTEVRAKANTRLFYLSNLIDELNTEYSTVELALTINDTEVEAFDKLIAAGVVRSDVQTTVAEIKLAHDAIKGGE